ncbi:low temperature requirement protein A [Mesorhizobium sp. ASY16-5R]|uniref:low temperature requirement protein A n=1 Tax=Mesorhizobium sp. ASY16-5R TaxID=3445772 RepID=UPI003FA0AE92
MTAGHTGSHGMIRRLVARDPAEHHRAATPLELLYDLVLVIAVAAAAAGLHHAVNENHVGQGVVIYLFVFWALWWPWVNFTWFASAYDNDDVIYRCLVFVQMVGALMTAVGVKDFSEGALTPLPLAGYIVMRFSMIVLWLRAARANPDGASCAYRYALGIAVCQVAWLAVFTLVPRDYFILAGLPVMLAEMAVPAFAEARVPTPWHRHHIIERYGLLTIIVFGESLVSAAAAISAIDGEAFANPAVWSVLVGSFLILFTMWWIYFGEHYHSALDTLRGAFLWGYSHYFIFASAAAVGAGIAIAVDQATHHSEISAAVASASVTIPAAVYLLSVWFAHDRRSRRGGFRSFQLPVFAVLVLLTPLAGFGVLLAGLLLTLCLALRIRQDAAD